MSLLTKIFINDKNFLFIQLKKTIMSIQEGKVKEK